MTGALELNRKSHPRGGYDTRAGDSMGYCREMGNIVDSGRFTEAKPTGCFFICDFSTIFHQVEASRVHTIKSPVLGAYVPSWDLAVYT